MCARWRTADPGAAAGCVEELERIVQQIRQTWPEVKIIVRGDSGFCGEELMPWCEDHGVDYVLALAKNDRLKAAIAREMEQAAAAFAQRGRRPGCSRSLPMGRATVGRERGGWWRRWNI